MKKTKHELPCGWSELPILTVAPLSKERVTAFKGKKPYLTTGGLDETEIRQLDFVTYEKRPTRADLIVRTGDVIVARMKDTAKVLEISPECNGLIVSTGFAVFRPTNRILSPYLAFFLRSNRFQFIKNKYAQGSTQKAINNKDLELITIPVPPVPVQERIVEILQKADEVRRKRQEALEITDAILPAAFRDIFGDPESNPFGWPVEILGKYIKESRYGTSERTGTYAKGDPVLRIPNVINKTINLSGLKYLAVSDAEKKKLLLHPGDILVVRTNGNKDYVGRSAVFDLEGEYLFASYLIRLRLQTEKLNPHYVVAFLTTPFGRREIDRNSRTSAGQYNISSAGLRAIRIPIPPLSKQLKFLDQYEQWRQTKARLDNARREADLIFHCLLSRAFTGGLTAEWEAENAEWIAKRQTFYERLPQMVLLAFLVEKARRASRRSAEAAVLVTALMKYTFLLQMEGNGWRRLYNFVPYHYGPFAKELYTDLGKLQEEGLVNVDNDTDEEKTRITLSDPDRAKETLSELPDDLKEDIATVLDAYGDLDHNTLLKRVYEKYPAYAKKSRVRRGKR